MKNRYLFVYRIDKGLMYRIFEEDRLQEEKLFTLNEYNDFHHHHKTIPIVKDKRSIYIFQFTSMTLMGDTGPLNIPGLRYLFDYIVMDGTSLSEYVSRITEEMILTLDGIKTIRLKETAIKILSEFNGIADVEDLEVARIVATEVIKEYGDLGPAAWAELEDLGIWNDHAAVQSALVAIKMARASVVQNYTNQLSSFKITDRKAYKGVICNIINDEETHHPEPVDHNTAIKLLCDCATSVTTLSYQEVIEGYFKLRGFPIP